MLAFARTRLRRIGPAAALYLLSALLIGFAIDGVAAVLTNLFLVRLGYGPAVIGIVNAAGMMTFACVSLPLGALGERWGSQRMLIGGLLVVALGGTLLPLADLMAPNQRLAWLIGSNIIFHLGLACYFVNGPPFLMTVVEADQRTSIFSTQVALLALAAFLGSLVGGILPQLVANTLGVTLNEPVAYRYPLLLIAVALLPAALAIAAIRPSSSRAVLEVPSSPDARGPEITRRALLVLLMLIAVVRLLQVVGLGAINTFFNVYLDAALHVPTAQIGTIMAVGRLLAAPMALLTPLLSHRIGNRNTVIVAVVGSALSMLPLALVAHWGAASLGFVGVIGLSTIRYASSIVYFMELVPPRWRGTVSGITEMSVGFSFAVVTFAGGYIANGLGYSTLFLLSAGITMLGALVFAVAFPPQRNG